MPQKISLSVLAEHIEARLIGDGDCMVSAVNTLSAAVAGEVSFLSNERYHNQLSETSASAVILREKFVENCQVKNLLVVDNPYLAFARSAQLFHQPEEAVKGIHETAVIADSAIISDSASIGPSCVIEAGVIVEEAVIIKPGCVLGRNSFIGKNSHLAANVTIAHEVKVGERCFIQSGAVIGSDGFGFANDHGTWVKIPQTGKVVVGNDVEIGANTTIDRGALGDTVIEDGVILDNQIQVAHNVKIGKNSAIAGGTAIAGSTSIGAGCTIGGLSGIVGHLTIADNVHISSMTEVTKSIKKPGHYTGNVPAMQHSDWSRNMVRLRQLNDLNDRVKHLEEKLKQLNLDS